MDLSTILGFLIAWILVIGGMAMGGGLRAYVDFPSMLITFGGTAGAVILSCSGEQLRSFGGLVRVVFASRTPNLMSKVATIVTFAEKARREGLLSLENDIEELDDPFLRKSIQLVVDGTDAELVQNILETEINELEERHLANKAIFDTGAELAPAFGMLGTLIGLISMLRNLQNVGALGPGMAVALTTTLYGTILANMLCIPVARKLAVRSAQEVSAMELVMEGVMAIQAGENPRIVEEKLKSFLPPRLRRRFEAMQESGEEE